MNQKRFLYKENVCSVGGQRYTSKFITTFFCDISLLIVYSN